MRFKIRKTSKQLLVVLTFIGLIRIQLVNEVNEEDDVTVAKAPFLLGRMNCSYKVEAVNAFTKFNQWSCSNNRVNPLCVTSLRPLQDVNLTSINVTLATHLTMDRLPALESLCTKWTGPISASIFLEDELRIRTHFSRSILKSLNALLNKFPYLNLHIARSDFTQKLYPVNTLRGLSLNLSATTHVFMHDIDFIPPINSYQTVMSHLKNVLNDKILYVIPVFETIDSAKNLPFPETKQILVQQYKKGLVNGFTFARLPETERYQHNATNFEMFIETNIPYKIEYEKGYEPYVVVHRDSPLPNPSFVGYHRNKMIYIAQLYAHGYEMVVLPDVYMIHLAHANSTAKRSLQKYRRCNDKLWMGAMRKLANQFKHKPQLIIPQNNKIVGIST